MLQPRRTIGTLTFILIGPLLWAAHLTAIYGSQSSLCAFDVGVSAGDSNTLVSVLVVVVTLVCIGFLAVAIWRPQPILGWLAPGEPPIDLAFLTWVMRALSCLAALAILYAGTASILLPACAQLR
jgi:hypothetical protein